MPARETCETCHWVEKFGAVRLRVIRKFGDDEANTPTDTVLMMLIGGSIMPGIHGAHFGPGVEIRFAAADKKRQTIPWVEYRNTTTGESRTYLASGTTPDSIKKFPIYQMQCVDCHNRPSHTFDLADRALDKALMAGLVPAGLPFIKKKGLELLQANYSTSEEAARKIPAGLDEYYRQTYPDVYAKRAADIAGAGRALLEIYNHNVFPDLKVGWGTYPNNLGHMDFAGLLPLSRWRSRIRRRQGGDHPGLHGVPRAPGGRGSRARGAEDARAQRPSRCPQEALTETAR